MTFSGPRVEERQPRAEDPRTGRGRYEIGADPRAKRKYPTRQYHGPMFKYVGLLVRLTELAKQRDFDDPVDCANATMRKIFRAIERKRSDKLNNWHYEKCKEQRNKEASKQHLQTEE